MKLFIICMTATAVTAGPQLVFKDSKKSGGSGDKGNGNVNTRLGLLAGQLGLDPIAQGGSSSGSSSNSGSLSSGSSSSSSSGSNAAFTSNVPEASGRIPGSDGQQCCCVPANQVCDDPFGGPDLVGGGFIDPRLKNNTSLRSGISTRIVNRPQANTNAQINTCPVGQKACCYDANIDLSVFGIICINPNSANQVPWTQGCSENVRVTSKTCGSRQVDAGANGGSHADSKPGEFPWTCLLLNQNNDFVGSCAVIPDDTNNDNSRPTRKIITAAHKLKSIQQNDLLKVRVGEWDASGFNSPERFNHQEYTIVRILKHPQFSAGRLSNDIALLYTDRDIDLSNPYVNTACLPSCDNQFDYVFNNGTGVRCWVAGWGKDEVDGSFQFIQKKVKIPLL